MTRSEFQNLANEVIQQESKNLAHLIEQDFKNLQKEGKDSQIALTTAIASNSIVFSTRITTLLLERAGIIQFDPE